LDAAGQNGGTRVDGKGDTADHQVVTNIQMTLEEKVIFWREHRMRMAASAACRAGWEAAMQVTKRPIPANVLRSLERAGFGPGFEFDCQHQIKVFQGGEYRCQDCDELTSTRNDKQKWRNK
jgi:hypothetical protein